MRRIILPICIGLLSILSSCGGENEHRLFYNQYQTYDQMTNHISLLNKNVPEDELFFFDVSFGKQYSINYFIAGVDYYFIDNNRPADTYESSFCNYLYTREMYYEIENEKSQIVATIVFKEATAISQQELTWTTGGELFHGTVLNYEQNAKNCEEYHLKCNDKEVLCIKIDKSFLDLEQILKDGVFTKVIENIK